jgi:hypothetical protein
VRFGGAKSLALVVDDYLGYCWSYFLRTKSGLNEKIIDMINVLKIVIKFLRVDNAGENFALENYVNNNMLKSSSSFQVERKFQELYGRIQAMFNDVDIEGDFRKSLRAECAPTSTYFENIIVKKHHNKLPLELMFMEKIKELKD